jgi:hypothetical protein
MFERVTLKVIGGNGDIANEGNVHSQDLQTGGMIEIGDARFQVVQVKRTYRNNGIIVDPKNTVCILRRGKQ